MCCHSFYRAFNCIINNFIQVGRLGFELENLALDYCVIHITLDYLLIYRCNKMFPIFANTFFFAFKAL